MVKARTVSRAKPARARSRYKTVPLHPSTYARLREYKVAGLSFDDVILRLMQQQDPETFHREYIAWQRRVLAKMEASGDYEPL